MFYSAYKLNKQGDNIQPDVLLFLFGTDKYLQKLFFFSEKIPRGSMAGSHYTVDAYLTFKKLPNVRVG